MPGVQILRERIAERWNPVWRAIIPIPKSPSPAVAQAIYTAITAVVRPGDEVIVIEPACPMIATYRRSNSPVVCRCMCNWSCHREKSIGEQVRKAIRPRTHDDHRQHSAQPTGSCFDASDLETLKQLTDGTEILILVTRSMEHILFDGRIHQSVADIRNWPTVRWWSSPLGRPIMLPAGRWAIVGACQSHERISSYTTVGFCANTPFQYALADAMQTRDYLGIPSSSKPNGIASSNC